MCKYSTGSTFEKNRNRDPCSPIDGTVLDLLGSFRANVACVIDLCERRAAVHLTEDRLCPKPEPQILVVGGGKGGVGKTCFAVNMAVEVARRGWRVVLVDADLSCANVEAVLGVRTPARLDDFFYQEGRKDLSQVLCDTPYDNLRLIAGTSGLLDVANPKYQKKMALIRELQQVDADLI
ncbi:MAG TPA: hypothetical protein ENN80_01085, partial [Candidatus Hydrogenedentes bacterium]|nr:hypothetical protein [Candidatus Hydrogenedentota bacterium]